MTIIVRPIAAFIQSGYDYIFFKKNPYVICQVGVEKQTSQSHLCGGKEPKWTDTFLFNAQADQMKVLLCDKTVFGKDNVIGQGVCNLIGMYDCIRKPQNFYVDILKDGKSVARVLLSIQCVAEIAGINKQNISKVGSQDTQFKRVSMMLSNQITQLSQAFNKNRNENRSSTIEAQPINKMSVSTVTDRRRSSSRTSLWDKNNIDQISNPTSMMSSTGPRIGAGINYPPKINESLNNNQPLVSNPIVEVVQNQPIIAASLLNSQPNPSNIYRPN